MKKHLSVFNLTLVKFHFHCLQELRGRQQKNLPLLTLSTCDFRACYYIVCYKWSTCHINLFSGYSYRLINPNSYGIDSVQPLCSFLLFLIFSQCNESFFEFGDQKLYTTCKMHGLTQWWHDLYSFSMWFPFWAGTKHWADFPQRYLLQFQDLVLWG